MKKYLNKFYCFSPSVMILTCIFEISAAFLAFLKYKNSDIKKLIIALLLALAGFQLAEFMVCGGFGFSGVEWARFGYVSITLLPPLGLHLVYKISGKKADFLVKFAYTTMIIFIAYYLFATSSVTEKVCRANYSVFNVKEIWKEFYAVYYYSWLIVAVFVASKQIRTLKSKLEKKILFKGDISKRISALKWLTGGYLSFMLPTTFVNIINPSTIEGIPSIMCGFAVIMAITLIGFVAPRTLEVKK